MTTGPLYCGYSTKSLQLAIIKLPIMAPACDNLTGFTGDPSDGSFSRYPSAMTSNVDSVQEVPPLPPLQSWTKLDGWFRKGRCLFCDKDGDLHIKAQGPNARPARVVLFHKALSQWYTPYSGFPEGFVCSEHRNILEMIQERFETEPAFVLDGKDFVYYIDADVELDKGQAYAEGSFGSRTQPEGVSSYNTTDREGDASTQPTVSEWQEGEQSASYVSKTEPVFEKPLEKQFEHIVHESGQPDAFRCSLCDAETNDPLPKARKKTKRERRTGKQKPLHPQLNAIYSDGAGRWVLPYIPPGQVVKPESIPIEVRGCDVHEERLSSLVEAVRQKSDLLPNYPTMQHATQPHLNLHLMTIREIKDIAKEMEERRTSS